MFNTSKGANATQLQSVQINSSNYGQPLPIQYGQGRLSTNVIWFNNFQAHGQSQGGKGGGGATSYTYTAAVMLALCEGSCAGIGNIYKDRSVITYAGGETPIAQDGLTFSNGAANQPVWSYLESAYPSQALAYSGTSWVANSNMSLDTSGGIPNYNLEVFGLFRSANPYNNRGAWSASTAYDAEDYVTDPDNGLPYVALQAVGPTSTAPSADGGTNWTAVWNSETDANLADIITDVLTNPRYGAYFPSTSIADLTDFRNYCIAAGFFFSPTLSQQTQVQQYLSDWVALANSAIVWSQGQLKIIPYGDEPLTGNGITWIPQNSPVFNLTDDDFISDSSTDPVQVDRTSPSDAINDLKIEFLDRSNNYNTATAEAMDQSAIDEFGLRTGTTITAHGICVASIAQLSLQLSLQRGLYIRNTYTFTLPINYCTLEPMDIVTINDSTLGFNELPVRINTIEEDDNFNLKITAEDFILGVGTALAQSSQVSTNIGTAVQAEPGNVATPIIFNPPQNLTNGNLEAWAAVSGGSNWGGAQVWISLDGDTYEYAGTTEGDARYGYSTADFPAGADPDTTDTLSVDLTVSGGQLDSGTDGQADSAATLCWINGELISYSAATLTAPNKYNLTGYIRRGQLSTVSEDHPSGAAFVRLDNEIFSFPYNANQIGSTVYVKFLSFNLFGNKLQSLADVSPYSVVLGIPPPDLKGFGIAVDSGGSTATYSWPPNTAVQVLNGGAVEIRFQSVTTGATWSAASFVGSAAGSSTSIDLPYIAGGTYLAKTVDANGIYALDAQIIQSGSSSGGGSLTVSVSPSSASGISSGVPSAGPFTVSASGGTPPYTYAWTFVSGDSGIEALNSTSAVTKFEDPTLSSSGIENAVYKCVVTDSASVSASTSNVTINLKSTGRE